MKNKQTKEKYSIWIWMLFWVFLIISFPFSLFSVIVLFACRPYFENWANEIDEKASSAFLIVLLFGLFGLLAYYIHYKQKLKFNNQKGGNK